MSKGMCGRCYNEVVDLFPANCAEKPEELLGQPIGQYHCPDCGAMVMAGMIHPMLCLRCVERTHPEFDSRPAAPESCANGRHADCTDEACECSHRASPPESETPEVDAAEWENSLQCSTLVVTSDLARSLERRLSLAQTEIKEYQAKHTAIMREGVRRYDEAQARIAELEKALAEHGTDAPGGIFS